MFSQNCYFTATQDSQQNSLCNQNGAIYISATGQDTLSYLWSPTNDTSQDLINVASGNYTVTVTDGNGCDTSLSFLVEDSCQCHINTDTILIIDTDSCTAITKLTAYPSNANNYQWNTGDTTQTISINQTGQYWCLIDSAGCTDTAFMQINSLPTSILNPIVIGQYPTDTNYLSDLIQANILPPQGISNAQVIVNGLLVIDTSGYTTMGYWIAQSQFYFGAGAGVDVKYLNNLYSLISYESTFESLCDTMWRGFKNFPKMKTAFLFSTIKDAHFGIDMQAESYNTLMDVNLVNNFIGVFIPPNQYDINNFTKLAFLRFDNCFFETQGNGLLFPYSNQTGFTNMEMPNPNYNHIGFAGVWAVNNRHLSISTFNTNANNTFENLQNGIGVLHLANTNFSETSLIEKAVFNNFYNNVGGLGIQSYNSKHFGIYSNNTGVSLNHLKISECTFNAVGTAIHSLNNSLSTRASVISHSSTGVYHYLKPNASSLIYENEINANVRGIKMMSNATVNTLMYNDNDITIYDNAFSVGIEINTPVAPNSAEIKYNQIHLKRLAGAGIFLSGSKGIELTKNNIDFIPDAIASNSHFYFGIIDHFGEKNIIAKNNIVYDLNGTTTSPNMGSNDPVGIVVNSSRFNIVECNETKRTYTGIRMNGSLNGLSFRGNTFGSHNTGLKYAAVINNGGNPIVQTNAGNMWIGSYDPINTTSQTGGGAYNNAGNNNQFAIIHQRFDINQNGNATLMPSSLFPNGPTLNNPFQPNWFPTITTGTAFVCSNSSFSLPAPLPPNSALMTQTAEGKLQTELYQAEVNKQEQRQLYAEMKTRPTLHNLSAKIDSFYTASEQGQLKTMYDANTLQEDIKQQAIIEKQTIDSLQDSTHFYRYEIYNLDSIHFSDTSLYHFDTSTMSFNIDTNYIYERKFLITKLEQYSLIIAQKETIVHQAEEQKADESIYKYSQAGTQETIDNNIRYTADLRMQIAYKNYSMSAFDIAQLYTIAEQCPLAGGEGVVAARSLLAQVIDTFWVDYERCLDEGYDIRKTDENNTENVIPVQTGISIFPNPSENKFYIKIPNNDIEKIKVQISGILGNQILDKVFEIEENRTIEINPKKLGLELNTGTYNISLFHNNKQIYNEKLIIE